MPEKTESAIPTFLLIGIAVLIIMNITSHRRIRTLETQLNNMHNNFHMQLGDVRHTSHMMWDISNRINELNEQVAQGTRLSFGEAVLIQDYHVATLSADVEVSFSLRTHTPGDVISVTARGQDGQLHNAVATPLGDGRFAASMNLPLEDSYVFTFTATGDTITTGELTRLNLADRLCGRFSFWLNQGHSSGPNRATTISLHPHFINNTDGDQRLNIASIVLYIETEGGEVITSWDFTEYLLNTVHGQQVLDLWWGRDFRLEVGAGDIRPDELAIARLVIYDNLGIRYEQIDQIFFPGQFDFGRSGVQSVPGISWTPGGAHIGRIRIIE